MGSREDDDAKGPQIQRKRKRVEGGSATGRISASCQQEMTDNTELLLQAVQARDLPQITTLLSQGISPDIIVGGVPILRDACVTGDLDLVYTLLNYGADVNAAGVTDGGSSLMTAALKGNTELCELLLGAGAAINQKAANGGTAIFCSAVRGHSHVTELLLRRGADPNFVGTMEGSTALHMAVMAGDYRGCELLLLAGADVNHQRFDQSSALCYAAAAGFTQICELLLRFNASTMIVSNDLLSPLCYAADGGHLQICELLLDHGACVHGQSYEAETSPLHRAVTSNRPQIVHLLLQRGADPVRRAQGTTALELASQSVNQELFSMMCLHLEGRSLR